MADPPAPNPPSAPPASFAALLTRRRRTLGAAPLLTYYDLGTGERTELSGTTFATWVDKTANLLLDADVAPGDVVALELLRAHPAHWVTQVWCGAVWLVGATVSADAAEDAVFRVVGPEAVADGSAGPASPYEPVLACSLHPLGLGFATALPDGVADYVDVRTFPDAFLGVPSDGRGDPAWRGSWPEAGTTLEQSSLFAPVDGGDARALLAPRPGEPPVEVVRQTIVRPLTGSGSTVVVVGTERAGGDGAGDEAERADRLDRIAASERATRG